MGSSLLTHLLRIFSFSCPSDHLIPAVSSILTSSCPPLTTLSSQSHSSSFLGCFSFPDSTPHSDNLPLQTHYSSNASPFRSVPSDKFLVTPAVPSKRQSSDLFRRLPFGFLILSEVSSARLLIASSPSDLCSPRIPPRWDQMPSGASSPGCALPPQPPLSDHIPSACAHPARLPAAVRPR